MERLKLSTIIDEDVWNQYGHCFSKSRLSSWSFCQIKFKKQYIDHTLQSETNHPMLIGSRFHQWAEVFLDIAMDHDPSTWESFIHPDFTEEEQKMLKWTINYERDKLLNMEYPELWKPLAIEYKIIDTKNELRGIIDRIDQVDNKTIAVGEWKTGSRIVKSSLMGEFGFYDILLDAVPEFKNMKRLYYVANPRIQEVQYMKPSYQSTIFRRIQAVKDAIATNEFVPTCTPKYRCNCETCTPEELLEFGVGDYCFS